MRKKYDTVKLVPEAPLRSKIKADLRIDELAIVESAPGPALRFKTKAGREGQGK